VNATAGKDLEYLERGLVEHELIEFTDREVASDHSSLNVSVTPATNPVTSESEVKHTFSQFLFEPVERF
jgi:hypothetical protein